MNAINKSKLEHLIESNKENPITDPSVIKSLIDDYVSICMKKGFKIAEEKQDAEQNHTYKQHMIPDFLLKDFSDDVTQMKNRLKVIEYSLPYGEGLSIITDFKKTNKFSVNENVYTMDEYHSYFDKTLDLEMNNFSYRVEYMLAIIEGDAAPLISWRNDDTSYFNKSKPYFYKLSHRASLNQRINNSQSQRIALSVFFAAQYLRSPLMKDVFDTLSNTSDTEKYPHKSFGKYILDHLSWIALVFYFRPWVWTSFKDTDLFITETPMTPYLEFDSKEIVMAEERALFMPIGRTKGVFFLQNNDFMAHHDSLLVSKDMEFSTHVLMSLLKFQYIEKVENMRKSKIVMHPETNLQHLIKMGEEESDLVIKKTEKLKKIRAEQESGNSFYKILNKAFDARNKRKDPVLYTIKIITDAKYAMDL